VVNLVTIGHGRTKMKKIDAINKIKKVLRKYKDGYEDEIINANEKDLSLIAKDILDSLEDVGMVPLKEFDCGCCTSYEWEDEE
jgi:hypothetical protein